MFFYSKILNIKINLLLFFVLLNSFELWANKDLKKAFPNPNLKPNEIVNIQLSAMKENDQTNLGIEITFRFASPKNKIQTGPIGRFILLVKNPTYRHLLNHLSANFLDLKVEGDRAIQEVIIETAEGTLKGFRFLLSLQKEDEFKNCWMTDAVIPFDILDA